VDVPAEARVSASAPGRVRQPYPPEVAGTFWRSERTVRVTVVHVSLSLYIAVVTIEALAVSEARQQLAAIIDRARSEHLPIYLARRGRRVAAVIDADDLDALLALAEDMSDIRAAAEARADIAATGATPIPWDEVKEDLGLT
jgi:prevent-host-death family protein